MSNSLDERSLIASLAARSAAARLSSAEEWCEKPRTAFSKFIRATPFRQGRGVYAPLSVQQHEAEFGRFVAYLEEHSPGTTVLNVGADRISMFLAHLRGRDPDQPGTKDKPAASREVLTGTKDRYLTLLDGVFNGLFMAGYRTDNPALEVQQRLNNPACEADAEIIFLSAEQDQRLIDYLLNDHATSTWRDRRRRAMLLFLHGTGVECSVARRATVRDFVLDDVEPGFDVRVIRSGGFVVNYRVPLAPFCLGPVLDWIKDRKRYLESPHCKDVSSEPLAFPSTESGGGMLSNSGLWRGAAPCLKAIGFEGRDVGGRVLRNTFIRRQILAGKRNAVIRDLVGLSSDTTLQRIRRMTQQHPDTRAA
ncbi:tyrosine-type recombinase/integrase [Paraburkholderia youngii]|uniref:tyrosine-type recombinase/integrase n=1 Tax=Paraburkholderia youngii TaxID=2782701 RepID=UPI003D1B7F33